MIDPCVRCDVYRNLNKPGVQFSIRQRGLVVGHRGEVMIRDVRFKHANPEQQAACRQRRKVCQWASGLLMNPVVGNLRWVKLCCDPKTSNGFCVEATQERLDSAEYLHLSAVGCWAVLKP